MHDAYTVGIPVFVILIGILLNQRGLDKLEARIERIQAELSARLDRMQADLSQFYKTLGEHDAKIDILMGDRSKPKG